MEPKTDIENMISDALKVANKFQEIYDITCNINDMWSHIKSALRAIMEWNDPFMTSTTQYTKYE